MLSRRNKTLKNIVNTLKEYRNNVADGETAEESDATTRRDILVGLLGFLDSCI
jgi:beta-catenin-like protein 1